MLPCFATLLCDECLFCRSISVGWVDEDLFTFFGAPKLLESKHPPHLPLSHFQPFRQPFTESTQLALQRDHTYPPHLPVRSRSCCFQLSGGWGWFAIPTGNRRPVIFPSLGSEWVTWRGLDEGVLLVSLEEDKQRSKQSTNQQKKTNKQKHEPFQIVPHSFPFQEDPSVPPPWEQMKQKAMAPKSPLGLEAERCVFSASKKRRFCSDPPGVWICLNILIANDCYDSEPFLVI